MMIVIDQGRLGWMQSCNPMRLDDEGLRNLNEADPH